MHDSTLLSPAMMTYARELDLPVDLILESPEYPSKQFKEPTEYVTNLSANIERVHNIARDNLAKSNERQKRSYDLKQFKYNYRLGEKVLLYTPAKKQGHCRKLSSPWTGPYTIAEILSDVLFRIKLNNQARDKVVHHNRLKPY